MLTDQEHRGLQLMENMGGGFASRLASAWMRADGENSEKLKRAFPEILAAYTEMAQTRQKGQERING